MSETIAAAVVSDAFGARVDSADLTEVCISPGL